MADLENLKREIKEMMVSELMLPMSVEEIGDEEVIFSPDGLGLDSVDALQLAVAVEKQFGLKITDAAMAREVMQTVNTVADAIAAKEVEKVSQAQPNVV
ncbi:acyl carrier protein [Phragmitibacter flavus]|uniref:Acyl carrier protein n=1 Tax=Phragmitibacter flavus TaxID=2576071 RepID=A0A5R8K9W2_9BACT|nr:phosphopantetheine-binding protein [Phragmitibacter flavus]TLD69076.1 acyl carrier protein [Phragmitibacter flavus]